MKKDIFAAANNRVSLFVQALLGERAQNGREYNNIAFTLHERDEAEKARRSVHFHVSAHLAEIWALDLRLAACNRLFKEEKEYNSVYRSIALSPIDGGTYRLSILNGTKDNVIYITLSSDERRALGQAIARVVSWYENRKIEEAYDFDI